LSPRDLFTSNRDWLDQWPLILPSLDALVFIADAQGWIGRGVHKEILDASSLTTPVMFLTPDGAVHPFDAIEFLDVALRGWRQYARIHVPMSRAPGVG